MYQYIAITTAAILGSTAVNLYWQHGVPLSVGFVVGVIAMHLMNKE